jgi:hypothetical protein
MQKIHGRWYDKANPPVKQPNRYKLPNLRNIVQHSRIFHWILYVIVKH